VSCWFRALHGTTVHHCRHHVLRVKKSYPLTLLKLVLNSCIVVGAIRNRGEDQRNPAPWIVWPALATQAINTAKNPFDDFQSWTWCVSCGWWKVQHLKQERFGKPCLKDLCGKCYQRGEFHPMNNKGDRLKGSLCPFPPHPQYCQQRFWYTS
jgi:hypothetical protein